MLEPAHPSIALQVPGEMSSSTERWFVGSSKVGAGHNESQHRCYVPRSNVKGGPTVVDIDGLAVVVKVHKDGVKERAANVQPRVEVERKRSIPPVAWDSDVGHLAIEADARCERRDRSSLEDLAHQPLFLRQAGKGKAKTHLPRLNDVPSLLLIKLARREPVDRLLAMLVKMGRSMVTLDEPERVLA